jgi:hypothetical protein
MVREWTLEALQIFATELYERHFNTHCMITFYLPSQRFHLEQDILNKQDSTQPDTSFS